MRRQRITITIETELLPAIDELVDGITIRNRSHALEVAVKRGIQLHSVSTLILSIQEDSEIDSNTITQYLSVFPISHVVLIAPQARAQDAALLSASFQKDHARTITSLPADFGDAAALQLALPSILGNALLVLGSGDPVPAAALLPALVSHTQRASIATQLVRPTGTRMHIGNTSIVQTAALSSLLAGNKSIRDDLFPLLAHNGTLNVYAY